MKKIRCIIVGLALSCLLLSGCAKAVREEPIDVEFTEAHDETSYYPVRVGKVWITMPYLQHYSDAYYVIYKIYYDDDSTRIVTREVSKETYESCKRMIDAEEIP